MTESLLRLAEQLADYLNEEALDHDTVATHDVLEALAGLGLTLVEDQIADSTFTHYESLPDPDRDEQERSVWLYPSVGRRSMAM